jgi:PAS domain S-box-containing protein
MTELVLVLDDRGRYLEIAPTNSKLLYRPSSELMGKTVHEIFPRSQADTFLACIKRALETGQPVDLEYSLPIGGENIWFAGTVSPMADGSVVWVARNITERKRAEEVQHFLAEASRTLAASLDYQTTLERVTRLALPALADCCVVELVREDGLLRDVAIAHVNPAKEELVRELRHGYPTESYPVAQALGTVESKIYPEITDAMLAAGAVNAAHLAGLREIAPKSLMIVPLVARGRTLGAILFVSSESGRRYGPADLPLAEDLASCCALAIDNARLYAAEQEARRTAQHAADRMARLQALTAALSEALTRDEVVAAVVKHGVAALAASAGSVALPDESGTEIEVVCAIGYPSEVLEAWHRFPVDASVPLADAVRTGEPVWLESREAWLARYPQLASAVASSDANASAALPLAEEGRVIGALGLSFGEAREFDEEDRAFMIALAQQCGQALERARLYEAERRARRRLQALHEVELTLAWGGDLDRLLSSVMEQARALLGATRAHLWLWDGEAEVLWAPTRTWSAPPSLPEVLPPGTGAVWLALRERRAVIVNDYQVWDGALPALRRMGIRAVVAVPLLADGRAPGVLAVATSEPRRYTDEDARLLEFFAQRAAQAIGGARSHAQTQEDAAAKAVLLDEVHHRVRNNLATVMTLLDFERQRRPPPTLEQSLTRVYRRVQGMAAVHTALSEQAFQAVDFRQVAEELCRHAANGDAVDGPVRFRRPRRAVELDAKRATALALVLNELLTNALKHGHADVRVSLGQRAGGICLRVRDGSDGPGRPRSAATGTEPRGVGLRLVMTLTERELNGAFRFELHERGSLAEVRFPQPAPRSEG